uniref:Uncharacterized protein n=1 Tax=Felis catus TaxID=9685 RepID=A0ABI7XCT4_FELCA
MKKMGKTARPPSTPDQEDEEREEENHGRRGEEDGARPSLVVGLGLFLVLGDAHLLHHALHYLHVGLRDVDAVVHKVVLVAVLIHWPVVHLVGVAVHVFTVVTVLVVVAKMNEGPAHGTPQHVAAEAPHYRPGCRGSGHVLHVGFRLTGFAPLTVGATTLTPAAAALGWVTVASRTALPRVPAPPSVPSSTRLRPLLAEAHVTPCGHKQNQDPAAYVAFHHDDVSAK